MLRHITSHDLANFGTWYMYIHLVINEHTCTQSNVCLGNLRLFYPRDRNASCGTLTEPNLGFNQTPTEQTKSLVNLNTDIRILSTVLSKFSSDIFWELTAMISSSVRWIFLSCALLGILLWRLIERRCCYKMLTIVLRHIVIPARFFSHK